MSNNSHFNRHRAAVIWGWDCHFCDVAMFCHQCYPELLGRPDVRPATLEHLIPRTSKGIRRGRDSVDNIVLSCYRCNNSKADNPLPSRKAYMGGHENPGPRYIKSETRHFNKGTSASLKTPLEHRSDARKSEWIVIENIIKGNYRASGLTILLPYRAKHARVES